MNRIAPAWLLPLAVLCVVMVPLRRAREDSARLAAKLRRAENLHQDASRLWQINRTLRLGQISAGELRSLEAEADECGALRRRLDQLRRPSDNGISASAPRHTDPAAIPAAEWDDAGQATPRETMISILWAASHGETDRLAQLIALSGEARVRAQSIFAQLPPDSQRDYRSAEHVVATLIAGSFPTDASAAAFNGGGEDGKAAYLSLSIDHPGQQTRTNVYSFSRQGDSWCLEVPNAVLAGLETELQGAPVVVAPSAP